MVDWKTHLHDQIWKPKSQAETKPDTISTANVPQIATASSAAATSPAPISDDHFYERLSQNTSLEQVPSVGKVMSILKTLENAVPDQLVRMKAALELATTQGLNLTDITQGIIQLQQKLSSEEEKFKHALDERRTKVADQEYQATKLEQDLHDLRIEISTNKQKIDIADTGFQGAFARRTSELQQLARQFEGAK